MSKYKFEFILCLLLGFFGAHKFYQKKYGMGFLYLITFGLFFIGYFIDLFKLFKLAFLLNEDEIKEYKENEIKINEQKLIEKRQKQEEFTRIMNSKPTVTSNKQSNEVCCPKCHSTSLTTTNKKISVGRAITGGVLLGGAGALVGGLTSKEIKVVCLNCGFRWKPGKH